MGNSQTVGLGKIILLDGGVLLINKLWRKFETEQTKARLWLYSGLEQVPTAWAGTCTSFRRKTCACEISMPEREHVSKWDRPSPEVAVGKIAMKR